MTPTGKNLCIFLLVGLSIAAIWIYYRLGKKQSESGRLIIETKKSTKKGIGANSALLTCDDFKVLDSIRWWYDWELGLSTTFVPKVQNRCPPETIDYLPEYVPMFWNHSEPKIKKISSDEMYVLGYNEPDLVVQSNIPAKVAADFWPTVEDYSCGLPIVSPAISVGGSWWLDWFFGNCTNCRFDYLGIHVYFCSVDDAMDYLEKMYAKYGMKIWVTEFGCPYSYDADKQLELMRGLLPRFEAADYIYRYAWFMARIIESEADSFTTPALSLLERDSSTLTPLGEFYNSFQPQDD